MEVVSRSDGTRSSSNLTKEDYREIVKNKTGTDDFVLLSYASIPVKSTLGFLGDYSKLTIEYELNQSRHTLYCFSKSIATANELVKNVSKICFKKEEFVYDTFVPLCRELGFEEIGKFAPDCYLTRKHGIIVMSDLSHDGFVSSNLSRPAHEDWLLAVTRRLSAFHACSILCERELSKRAKSDVSLGDVYEEYLRETNFDRSKQYGQCMTFGVNYIHRYFIDKLDDYVPGRLSREDFKDETKKIVEKVFSDFDRSPKYKNVICHRDLWASNILTNGNACIFVDYQLIKYSPPAIDLLFLIYMNTDRDTRNDCMAMLVKEYYERLDEILKKHETDIAAVFSFDSFLVSCEDLKSTIICQCLAYLQVLFLPENVLEEINNDEEKAAKYFSQDRKDIMDRAWMNEGFRKRVTELMDELFVICERNFEKNVFSL